MVCNCSRTWLNFFAFSVARTKFFQTRERRMICAVLISLLIYPAGQRMANFYFKPLIFANPTTPWDIAMSHITPWDIDSHIAMRYRIKIATFCYNRGFQCMNRVPHGPSKLQFLLPAIYSRFIRHKTRRCHGMSKKIAKIGYTYIWVFWYTNQVLQLHGFADSVSES